MGWGGSYKKTVIIIKLLVFGLYFVVAGFDGDWRFGKIRLTIA